ncbi:hypothetical protein M2306_001860 [Myroides gitamensis]|uniref:hypothetical protein n=1 Tax=Myroides odoratus TaxID=256 RepID=UPI002168A6B4|nr:hypothetical protein [Myroides odoratus]MCS4239757.1 hypothetical protein [Myroides odoratus]MDH6601166.1 hypothetical protein [Myroides gitamensis]
MKNFLLTFLLLFPLLISAKSYKGTVYYKNDNRAVHLEIEMPLKVNAKKLKVRIDGQKQSLDASTLAYMDIYINDGQKKISFRRGKVSHFKKNGEIRKRQNVDVWSMITDVNENIIVSAAGLMYDVKKKKGEEYILIIFDPLSQGFYLSKHNSDILVNTDPYLDESFESKIGGAKELLFPECENIMELYAEAQKSEKKSNRLHVLLETYKTCLTNQ